MNPAVPLLAVGCVLALTGQAAAQRIHIEREQVESAEPRLAPAPPVRYAWIVLVSYDGSVRNQEAVEVAESEAEALAAADRLLASDRLPPYPLRSNCLIRVYGNACPDDEEARQRTAVTRNYISMMAESYDEVRWGRRIAVLLAFVDADMLRACNVMIDGYNAAREEGKARFGYYVAAAPAIERLDEWKADGLPVPPEEAPKPKAGEKR